MHTHSRRRSRARCPHCTGTIGRQDNLKRHIQGAHPDKCEAVSEEETTNEDEGDAKSATPEPAPWKPQEIPPASPGPSGVDQYQSSEKRALNRELLDTKVDKTKVDKTKVDKTNVDERDDRGWTRLHWAVFARDVSRVRELLALGATPNIKCSAGRAPYDFAVMFASGRDVVNLLQGV